MTSVPLRPSRTLRQLASAQAMGVGPRGSELTVSVRSQIGGFIEVCKAGAYFEAIGDEDRNAQCRDIAYQAVDELLDDLTQLLIEADLPRTARAWTLGALTSLGNWRQHGQPLQITVV